MRVQGGRSDVNQVGPLLSGPAAAGFHHGRRAGAGGLCAFVAVQGGVEPSIGVMAAYRTGTSHPIRCRPGFGEAAGKAAPARWPGPGGRALPNDRCRVTETCASITEMGTTQPASSHGTIGAGEASTRLTASTTWAQFCSDVTSMCM